MSPTSRLNTTLPTSTTSTLERPASGIRPPSSLRNKQEPQQHIPQQQQQQQISQQPPPPPQQPPLLKKSPPPAVPLLNLRPQNNGLLTTIEQAAMSDEEPGSPVNLNESLIRPASALGSRIPTPNFNNSQPNYENVVNTKLRESPINSMIPVVAKKSSLPNDRISTANFVASSPVRKQSLETAKRTFPSPSVISPLARPSSVSKIPIPGGNQSGMKS